MTASSGRCVPQFLRKSLKFKVKNADLSDSNSETQDFFLGHLSLLQRKCHAVYSISCLRVCVCACVLVFMNILLLM